MPLPGGTFGVCVIGGMSCPVLTLISPNPIKICLIVKPYLVCQAKALFRGIGVVISDSGRCHLLVFGQKNFWLVILVVNLVLYCSDYSSIFSSS